MTSFSGDLGRFSALESATFPLRPKKCGIRFFLGAACSFGAGPIHRRMKKLSQQTFSMADVKTRLPHNKPFERKSKGIQDSNDR